MINNKCIHVQIQKKKMICVLLFSLFFIAGCGFGKNDDLNKAENNLTNTEEERGEEEKNSGLIDSEEKEATEASADTDDPCRKQFAISAEDLAEFVSSKTEGLAGRYTLITKYFVPTDDLLDKLITNYGICLAAEDEYQGIEQRDVLRIKAYAAAYSEFYRQNYSKAGSKISAHHNNKFVFHVGHEKQTFKIYPRINARDFGRLEFAEDVFLDNIEFYKNDANVYLLTAKGLRQIDGATPDAFNVYTTPDYFNNGAMYFYDKNNVYFLDKDKNFLKIAGALPESFHEIQANFFADDKSVYYYNAEQKTYHLIAGADPKTFTFGFGRLDWGGDYLLDRIRTDENSAFYYDYDSGSFKKMPNFNIQLENFVFLNIFKRNDGYYYFSDTTPAPVKVADMSNGDLRAIYMGYEETGFYKNDREVFVYDLDAYSLHKLDGVDVSTFELIGGMTRDLVLFKDKNGLYIIESRDVTQKRKLEVDVQTMKILSDSYDSFLFSDKNNVYTLDSYGVLSVVEISDLDSFEFLGLYGDCLIAKDKNNLYLGRSSLKKAATGADARSFEVVEYSYVAYGKDKDNIYYVARNSDKLEILAGADPDTFSLRGPILSWYFYATDQNSVWFYDNNTDTVKKIEGADPDNFDFEGHAREYFN